MSDDVIINYVGPDEIEQLKAFKQKLKACVDKELAGKKKVIKQLHDFVELGYEMLKTYETEQHAVSEEFRQTQYEHLILFCFALQAVPEAQENEALQSVVKEISEKIGIDYPLDMMDCCDIFDKVIRLDDNLVSGYNLTYVLLKLENPITKKAGMRDFLKILQSLLTQLDTKEPMHLFLSVIEQYVHKQIA